MQFTPFTIHTFYCAPFTFTALVVSIILQFLLQKVIHTLENHILVVRDWQTSATQFFSEKVSEFWAVNEFRRKFSIVDVWQDPDTPLCEKKCKKIMELMVS